MQAASNVTCDVKINPINAVVQDNTGGFTLCGLRGGLPYRNVTRVDPTTLACPSGTVPCSTNTSATNTVCYPSNQLATSCPINGIEITSDLNHAKALRTAGWSYHALKVWVDYVAFYVLWSTNQDSLPITQTKFESQPCMNPLDVSQQTGQQFYPLEVD